MQPPYSYLKIFVFSKTLITLVFLFFSSAIFSQVHVTPNKENGTYNVNEAMTFNVTANSAGQVDWVLKYDNFAPIISSGTMTIFPNQTKTIAYTATEPGVVICEVTKGSNKDVGSAAFAPFDIAPMEEEPSDFDAFWDGQKAILAGVPINANITFFQSNTYSTTYLVTLDNVDNRKVYGYLVVPNGGGPFPVVLELPPYGDVVDIALPAVNFAEQTGVIVLSITIHNTPPYQAAPNAYTPDNFANEYESYYRWAILAGIRSLDYLVSRSDFNGTDVAVVGVSQGAGLASIMAGVDSRVKLLALSNPVLCQNAGLHYDRAGGFPNFIQTSRNLYGTAAHEAATINATRYYDAMFHIRRYHGPMYANLSYEDQTTPAATGFAMMNQFDGKRILLHSLNLNHSHPFEYWVNRQDFFRRVFPVTLTSHSFPWSSNNQGYWVEAGDDQVVNGTANLNASIQKNGENNPNFILKWRKVSGAGTVSFSNPTAYNTSATFSADGTYVLEFSGVDEAQLAGDRKYFTISDRVTITVGGSTGGGNTPPTGTLTTASNNVTMPFVVDAIFSENVTDFILSDLTITNGTASNFTGSGSNYSFTITPIADGEVTVVIPIFKVLDNQGMGNNSPSNTLVVNYTSANTGGGNCDTPTNLALNKTATQHSTQFNADASRAVDGNNDGDFWGGNSISLTNWVDNPWWEVDLGTVAQIQTIKIWNRTDCCQSILSDYHVLVSDVPFTSTSLDAAINQNGVGDFLEMGSAGTPTTININRNGRYVRIQLAGQGFLGLAEVEVLGCTGGNTGGGGTGSSCTSPSNIASVGTAIQSSVQFEGTANKAIDGNTIGAFWDLSRPVSLTNWEDNAWWEIDLGAVADINELKIWNRNDCCENILKNYYVLVSDVPFTSSNLNTSINQSGVFSELQTTEAARPSTIAINRTGRYLRIQLQGQGFLALSEVEIMGCISNGINNNPPVFLTQADALPFQAIKEKEEVHLIWSTNTEWANDKFFIEKSIDGVHFEKIAKVNSQSDDAGLYFYQEIDAHPFLGKNYYRLHRIIKDGSEDYSAVFEVEFDSDKKELSIFPNPTNEKISVNISTFLGKDIQIQIFDARGFLVLEKNIKESSKHILPFDLKKYPSGLYFLSLKVNKQKRITQSFMITKY